MYLAHRNPIVQAEIEIMKSEQLDSSPVGDRKYGDSGLPLFEKTRKGGELI